MREEFICAGPQDDTDRECPNPESRMKLEGYRCRECDGYFCAPCADEHFKFNPLRQATKSAERCYEMQKDAYQNAMANAERLNAENLRLAGEVERLKKRVEMAEFLVRGGDKDAALSVLRDESKGIKS